MDTFDPTASEFVKLRGFQYPGGVAVYEYVNHTAVDGSPDFLRINAYLSKDGEYVTIWRGLLEPLFVKPMLGFVDLPQGFDFDSNYREELFRGYIESREAAMHILKALRLDSVPPQVLSAGADSKLQCDLAADR